MKGRLFKYFDFEEMGVNADLVFSPAVVEHGQMMDELREWAATYYPNFFARNGLIVSKRGWFRNVKDNKAAKGASNSAHLDARATDINNIPSTLYDEFTTAWQVICMKHKKVGGVVLYHWGMHFDSFSDKFGVKVFRIDDKR